MSNSERAELLLQATASRIVGPSAVVGFRGDSTLTVVEAEFAGVVGWGCRLQ